MKGPVAVFSGAVTMSQRRQPNSRAGRRLAVFNSATNLLLLLMTAAGSASVATTRTPATAALLAVCLLATSAPSVAGASHNWGSPVLPRSMSALVSGNGVAAAAGSSSAAIAGATTGLAAASVSGGVGTGSGGGTASLGEAVRPKSNRYLEVSRTGERPYFDDVSPRNVTAIVGQQAVLNCRVKHLGDRTVSWMRKRDLHILTSNIFTYTGDARFGVIHPEASDEWNLRIEYVQERDAGIYECQVNTEPKINMAIMLAVEAAAQANIWGPEEVYVKKGSTISLTCSINVHSTPPGSVLWYHGAAVVDFDSPRGGISLETEKTEAGTTSKLLVTKAALTDSGNYTCVPSNANPASVWVHVLNGEHPAAMQHGEHGACSPLRVRCLCMPLLAALLPLLLLARPPLQLPAAR